jgi:predicted dehydrogenase
MVDQAFVLFGKPLAVTAHLKTVRQGGFVPDYYDIRLEYSNFSAILKCSYLVHTAGPRYILHGEHGSFYKSGIDPQEELLKAGALPTGGQWGNEPQELWGTISYQKDGLQFEETVETIQGNYNHFYDNVYEAIRKGAELFVKPIESVEVLKIIEVCVKSSLLKKTIEI